MAGNLFMKVRHRGDRLKILTAVRLVTDRGLYGFHGIRAILEHMVETGQITKRSREQFRGATAGLYATDLERHADELVVRDGR